MDTPDPHFVKPEYRFPLDGKKEGEGSGSPLTSDSARLGYDAVTLPPHYANFAIEPVRFIMENRLEPAEANVVKYVCRWKLKNGIEDLKKARRYLDMLIAREEGQANWWLR